MYIYIIYIILSLILLNCVKFTISRLIVNQSNLYLANNSKKLRQKENS